MYNCVIFLSCFFSQSFHHKINHSRQRRIVSCFIIKGFILFAVKTISSFYFLGEHERDETHIVSLIIYILSTELSALAGYQFVFFAFCGKCRYEALVEEAEKQLIVFEYGKCGGVVERNIQLVEDLAALHFQVAKVFEAINEIFSVEVSVWEGNGKVFVLKLINEKLGNVRKCNNFCLIQEMQF
jgi:hypothetical protein